MRQVSREPEPSDAKLLRRIGQQLTGHKAPPTPMMNAPATPGGFGGGHGGSGHGPATPGPASSAYPATPGGAGGGAGGVEDFFRVGGRRGVKAEAFGIVHFAGQVTYSVTDWIAKNTDYLPAGSGAVLGESASAILQRMAASGAAGGAASGLGAGGAASAAADIEGDGKGGGRAGQAKTATKNSSFLKKATVADSFMKSMQSLMVTLRSTQCSFIRCLKPNKELSPAYLDHALVTSQLQSLGITQVEQTPSHSGHSNHNSSQERKISQTSANAPHSYC